MCKEECSAQACYGTIGYLTCSDTDRDGCKEIGQQPIFCDTGACQGRLLYNDENGAVYEYYQRRPSVCISGACESPQPFYGYADNIWWFSCNGYGCSYDGKKCLTYYTSACTTDAHCISNYGPGHACLATGQCVSTAPTYDNQMGDGEGCFLSGTLVSMADGSKKSIEDILVWDKILAYDEETKTHAINEVLELQSQISKGYYNITLSDSTILQVTSNHALYFSDGKYTGWGSINPYETLIQDKKFVRKLNVCDKLFKEDGSFVTITGIVYIPTPVKTYNLKSVENSHTYYADGLLVHNKDCILYNTLIIGEDGKPVKIQDLDLGDEITSIDVISEKLLSTKITKIIKQHLRGYYYSINNELNITNDHPVLVLTDKKLEWVKVADLVVGEKIKSVHGYTTINTIERIDKLAVTVYLETEAGNFIVMANSNYYVVKSNYANKK